MVIAHTSIVIESDTGLFKCLGQPALQFAQVRQSETSVGLAFQISGINIDPQSILQLIVGSFETTNFDIGIRQKAMGMRLSVWIS